GQVVIAKEIRARLGVKPGWAALQRVVGDRVEVISLPPEHNKSLKGTLARYVKHTVAHGAAWDRAREQAWRAAARDKARAKHEDLRG
ncbi:MAG: AbrB/MazE/SpoVT family DNA-binding domain-containing protein, partial [SAR202 cluster bacterium]|nr:AbrB/MazE/SpoVT family DNA-binding domain-containing protein [SAR202 cluster bacterium]